MARRTSTVFNQNGTVRHMVNFPTDLAYQLWHIGVNGTPMDTGNARANTKLLVNNSNTIAIGWDTFNANYVDLLERGVGPVKKYKGFISSHIFYNMVNAVSLWASFGIVDGVWGTPVVFTGLSKQPFSYERSILKQAGKINETITASEREMISKFRQTYGLNIHRGQRSIGKGVATMETHGERPINVLWGANRPKNILNGVRIGG